MTTPLNPPSWQSLGSQLPGELSRQLSAAFQAQDKYGRDVATKLGGALVVGESLRVYTPYTATSPLAVPADWVTVTAFTNSWVQMVGREAVAYRKDASGTVFLKGEISTGTFFADAFQLPATHAPGYNHYAPVYSNNGATAVVSMVLVGSGGNVQPAYGNNGEIALSNISFPCSDRSPYVPSCFPFTAGVWPLISSPTAVLVFASDVTTSGGTTLGVGVPTWTITATGQTQLLSISYVSGLLPSKSYAITVVAF